MNYLKDMLLNTGVILDNDYLDLYVQLIHRNKDRTAEKGITQVHHVIPRAFFKYQNIQVDESPKNKVVLRYKDHILAHYYLSLCSTHWFKYYAQAAVVCMIDFHPRVAEDLIPLLSEYQCLYEEFKLRQSSLLSQKLTGTKVGNGHTGKRYMNNGSRCVCVYPDEFYMYLDTGYTFGRLTSEQGRKNISDAQRGKPKYSLRDKPKTESCKSKLSAINKDKIYLTNGTDERWFPAETDISPYISAGWTVGRKPMSVEHRQNLAIAKRGKPSPRKGVRCSDEQRKLLQEVAKGRVWVNNGQISKMIYPDQLQQYLDSGFERGRMRWGK